MKLFVSLLLIFALHLTSTTAAPQDKCDFSKNVPAPAARYAFDKAVTTHAKKLEGEDLARQVSSATPTSINGKGNGKDGGGGNGGSGGNGGGNSKGAGAVDPCLQNYADITVGVVWYAFSDGPDGRYTDADAQAHIDLFNEAAQYSCTKLKLELVGPIKKIDISTDPLLQAAWGQYPLNPNTQYAKKIKQSYPGPSDCTTFAVWTWYFDPTQSVGFAQFPQFCNDAEVGTEDGVAMDARAMMAHDNEEYGKLGRWNRGMTFVHEAGHAMGLYHTHQGGCADGDQVDDTPACQQLSGCVLNGIDTCPKKKNPGIDLVYNFMSNSDDVCMESFTKGQLYRMRALAELYRI